MRFNITTGSTPGNTMNHANPQRPINKTPLNSRGSWAATAIVGVVLLLVGVFLALQGNKSEDWPTVEAVVRSVDSSQRLDADDNFYTEYRASSEYTVNGNSYSADETTRSYTTVGQTKAVKYNPDNPSETAGMHDASLGWIFSGIGAVLTVLGTVMFFVAKRNSVSDQPASPGQV